MSDRTASDMRSSLNTPLEVGIRLLFVLDRSAPAACDVDRLLAYDYLLVHSGDVPGGPPSLHAAVPHRSGEYLVRRPLVHEALDLMLSRRLLDKRFAGDGVAYAATWLALRFLAYFESEYAQLLRVRADWVVSAFGSVASDELARFMTDNLGRWGAEFDRESVLRGIPR